MDPVSSLLALGGLVIVATALGLVWKARQGVIRRDTHDGVVPREFLVQDAWLTLLQVSSPMCSYCPAMRSVLSAEAESRPGVAHRDIDISEAPELIQTLHIRQTPTTLLVTRDGHVAATIKGAAPRSVVAEAIDTAAAERKAQSDEYRI